MPRPSKQTVLFNTEDRLQKLEIEVGRLGRELSRIQEALAKLVNTLIETDANSAQKPKALLTNDELRAQEIAAFLESNRKTIEQTVSGYVQTQLQGMLPHPASRRRTSKGGVLLQDGLAAVAGTRDLITTTEAAAVLNFKENTLRK